jgi:hypothetical protein
MTGQAGDGLIAITYLVTNGGVQTGTPSYVKAGYVKVGYQRYDGAGSIADHNDITYTVPYGVPTDDGVAFPLTKESAFLDGPHFDFGGLTDAQAAAIAVMETLAGVDPNYTRNTFLPPGTSVAQIQADNEIAAAKAADVIYGEVQRASANPARYAAALRPLDGGPFGAEYSLQTSTLPIPMKINLEAGS